MTLLVYMAANNSLGRDRKDLDDIDEMIKAARAGALAGGARVLVFRSEYYGSRSQRLMELTPDSLRTLITYADDGTPASDPERLRRVIADTRAKAPADHYGLVLWSHGLGWTNLSFDSKLRSFGEDRTTGRMMAISELGGALDADAFDFIYFDCCLMSSVEVAYELRHAAPYLCGSVTETPYDGMPYDKTLPLLLDGSPSALEATARTVMEHYGVHTFGSCPVSAVVVATEALDDLAAATVEIYSTARELPEDFTPQQFYFSSRYPEYRYYDLEQYVETICPDQAMLDSWREILGRVVKFQAHSDYIWSTDHPITRHCGLSTRILFKASDSGVLGYSDLQWYSDVVSLLRFPDSAISK